MTRASLWIPCLALSFSMLSKANAYPEHEDSAIANRAASPTRLALAYYTGSAKGEIILVDPSGKQLENLTLNPRHTDNYPAWSPRGDKIAFNSHRTGGWAIWIMNADGSDAHRLARISNRTLNPTWSPDGKQIAFFADFGGYWNLGIVDANGKNLRRLTNDKSINRDPCFSPDGKEILFYSSRTGVFDLWTIRPDGTGLRNLTQTEDRHEVAGAWSPDGKRLACYEVPDRADVLDGSVVVMDRQGKNRRSLAPVVGAPGVDYRDVRLTWSPDGEEIVFVSYKGNSKGRLFRVPSDGSGKAKAMASLPGRQLDPCWCPIGVEKR